MSNKSSLENTLSNIIGRLSADRADLNDIIEKNPKKAIKTLALPTFFSLFCLTLNGLVDSVFVAECGASSLIGVGIIQSIFVIIVGIGTGLSVATNSSLSYAISKYSTKDRAQQIIYNTIILTLVVGIISSILLAIFLKPLLILFNIHDALGPALTYGQVLFSGNVFFFFAAVIPAILRAEGEVMKTTYSLISTSLLNIVLDYVLIHVLGYGVFGAACATTFCSAVCCALLVYFMVRSDSIHIEWSKFVPNISLSIIKKLFLDALPVAFECGVISLFSFIANMIFNYFASPAEFAGFVAAYKVYNFVIIPIIALAESNVTLISYLYGKNDFERMKSLLKYELKIGLAICLALWLIILVFREQIAYLYSISNTGALIGPIATALPVLNVMLLIMPLGLLSVSILQGIQAFKESFIVSTIRSIALELFFGFIFAYILSSTYGIYLGFIVGAIVGCIFSYVVMRVMINKRNESVLEGVDV